MRNQTYPTHSSLKLETLEPRQLLSVFGGMFQHHSYDHGQNNSPRLAESIELDETGNTTIEGNISSARDRDYYTFTVEYSGTVSISMESLDTDDSALDTYLTVYNSRKRKIAVNDDISQDNTNSYIEFYAEAGDTFYIRADGYRRSTGDYSISLTTSTVNESYGEDTDYANNISGSIEISSLAAEDGIISIDGAIYPATDLDVFTFTVQSDGEYAVSMSANGSDLDTYLYIYNENGKLVYRNDDIEKGNLDSYIEFTAEEGEIYYIRADAWKHSIGTYTITVENLSAPLTDENEEEVITTPEDQTDDTQNDDQTDASEGWVLIIGAYDYQGFQNDLTGPAYDIELISEIFTDYYSVPDENVHVLSGGYNVNEQTIEQQVEWLAENADSNDYVVIYYSGHGTAGDSENIDDNESLYLPDSSYIYQADIENWLNTINSDTDKVIILDSCYAGGFLDIANNVPNTAVIASTSYSQTAWDAVQEYYPQGNTYRNGGVFATWLNYGILSGNADSNSDNYVNLLEAFNYADLGINRITSSNEYNQDPVINYSLDFDLAIFLS